MVNNTLSGCNLPRLWDLTWNLKEFVSDEVSEGCGNGIPHHRLPALRLATGENFPDTFWPHGSAILVMRTMTVVRFALKHFSEKDEKGRKMQQSTSICIPQVSGRCSHNYSKKFRIRLQPGFQTPIFPSIHGWRHPTHPPLVGSQEPEQPLRAASAPAERPVSRPRTTPEGGGAAALLVEAEHKVGPLGVGGWSTWFYWRFLLTMSTNWWDGSWWLGRWNQIR